MTLPPGARFGVYEITAPIGAGGLAEVYRATDTRLKRQVAIKILPCRSRLITIGSRVSSARRKYSRP